MASTDGKNASLFGDDSDSSSSSSSSSSDVSVGRRNATEPDATGSSTKEEDDKATSGEGGKDADGGGDAGEAASTAATSATKDDEDGGDEMSGKEKNAETHLDGGDKDQDKDTAEADEGKRASLFGDDDDDSSDDDEFDGDDGIVGRSTGSGAAAVAPGGPGPSAVEPAPRTMNQTLGLDSDSDDDHKRAIVEAKEQQKKKEEETPLYRPPRRMELLSLTEEETKRENVFHVAKLPNLVGINTTPYDKRSHDKEAEEEHYRGYVHNIIRWRHRYRRDGDDERELLRDEKGNPVRESNARLVKWSDGSYTLHVGTEVLEVDSLDSSAPSTAAAPTDGAPGAARPLPGFAGINGYLYVSQKAKIRPPSRRELAKARHGGTLPENHRDLPSSDDDDDDDDAARPAGTILECLGPIASRFAPRPSSLASEAHRNLTLAVRQRNVKRARIAEIVTEVDPEQEKLARIKGKDDLEKSRRGKMGGGRRGGGGRRSHGRGMNATYLEEDGDYDGVNLGRLKRQTMRRDVYSDEEDADMDYGEDSEEEEDEWSKKKKRRPNKDAARRGGGDGGKRRGRPEWDDEDEDEEEGELVFGDDDDEGDDAAMFKKRGGGGASKKAVLDDDDD